MKIDLAGPHRFGYARPLAGLSTLVVRETRNHADLEATSQPARPASRTRPHQAALGRVLVPPACVSVDLPDQVNIDRRPDPETRAGASSERVRGVVGWQVA
jgi:hypothetical protein